MIEWYSFLCVAATGVCIQNTSSIGGDLHSFLQGLDSTAFCGAILRLPLFHQLRSTLFSPRTEINSVLRSRFSTPAISPTEVYTVFSQDTTAFAEQIFATPVVSPNEVITHFSQDKVQQRLHPQRELYAMSRCQVARSLSHLQQQDCVRWCHLLFLVLPVGVLIVLRLPVSCQQLESDL